MSHFYEQMTDAEFEAWRDRSQEAGKAMCPHLSMSSRQDWRIGFSLGCQGLPVPQETHTPHYEGYRTGLAWAVEQQYDRFFPKP